MMDVIFNGSGNRKPAGMAEVTLVFDNPKREDGTRLLNLDTDEVSVGRRLFRDGTSEYQINNGRSRLKDIRELFLDTGVGVDAYSVIEQGRVAALLEANPEERRMIFEEAAGISKYKLKKKEAQRKLEKVDQNLLRVNDIVEEVDKRLRSVKIQAGRARTFQEYSTRLNELRLTYSLQEYHTHNEQLKGLERSARMLQFRLDDASANLAKGAERARRKSARQFDGAFAEKAALEYELVQAVAADAVGPAAAAIRPAAARADRRADRRIRAGQADGPGEAGRSERHRSNPETAELQKLTAELEEQQQHIDERQQAFRDGQLQLNAQPGDRAEQGGDSRPDAQARERQQSASASIEIERKNIAAQQTRLAERRQIVVGEIEQLDSQARRASSQARAAIAVTITEQQAPA